MTNQIENRPNNIEFDYEKHAQQCIEEYINEVKSKVVELEQKLNTLGFTSPEDVKKYLENNDDPDYESFKKLREKLSIVNFSSKDAKEVADNLNIGNKVGLKFSRMELGQLEKYGEENGRKIAEILKEVYIEYGKHLVESKDSELRKIEEKIKSEVESKKEELMDKFKQGYEIVEWPDGTVSLAKPKSVATDISDDQIKSKLDEMIQKQIEATQKKYSLKTFNIVFVTAYETGNSLKNFGTDFDTLMDGCGFNRETKKEQMEAYIGRSI